jgi:hypothetical protein
MQAEAVAQSLALPSSDVPPLLHLQHDLQNRIMTNVQHDNQ